MTTYDADSLKQMSGEQKLALLDQLIEQAMPGATDTAVAKAIGSTARSLYGWRSNPDRIPVAELLLLQEMGKPRGTFEAIETLAELSDQFSKLAETMHKLAKKIT